jgi:translocation and assembly module TamB
VIWVSKPQKIILGSLIGLLVFTGFAWKIVAPRVLTGVQERLLAQVNSAINGRIEMETVDFSVLGAAVLKKVVLLDPNGGKIAASDEIAIRYKFSDVLAGRFGVDSISKITAEQLTLKLEIDQAGNWSLQKIIKPQPERKTEFRGSIVVNAATVAVTTPNWRRDFTDIVGELDYANSPTIVVDVKGKMGASSIAASGHWVPDQNTQLALKIDAIDLAEVQSLLPVATGAPQLTAGTLKNIQGTVAQTKDSVQMNGEGTLAGLAMNFQGLAVTDGNAKLKLQGKKVTLQDASMTVDGNKVTVTGAVDFTPNSPVLALQAVGPAVNLTNLPGLGVAVHGTAAIQAEISGTITKPLVNGSFQLPSGQYDEIAIAEAEGSFSYAGDAMILNQAAFKAMGGAFGLSGTVAVKPVRVNLKVTGQNVDGSMLTNKGLTGRMDFNAAVTGASGSDDLTANGTFTIGSGSVGEYTIANAAGSFRKQGRRLDLSNVGVTLSGQRLSVNGMVTLAANGASPQINLQIASSGMNTTVFNPNSALRGNIAFQTTLTGTSDNNQARGNFQIASGTLGELAFSGASGGFSYAGGVLTLVGGRAQCLGGVITLNGTVVPKTMEYHQQVNGQNIDAAQLTDRDVQGRAEFAATISGVGDWDKANGDGNFKMNSGSVKGISFNGLTGNFAKRGRQTEFRNLKFNMLGGLATGTGETEGEYVHLVITPNAVANTALSILTGRSLQPQDLRIRFRGPNG